MRHRLSTLLGGAALIGAAATGPVSAAGADHTFYPENYDAYEHFAAGEGFCVTWAGTFHEVRHGGYRLVAAPGGQQPDELHINGVITAPSSSSPTTGRCRHTPGTTARR